MIYYDKAPTKITEYEIMLGSPDIDPLQREWLRKRIWELTDIYNQFK